MIYIGIDPGGSGGIAWLSDSGVYQGAAKMPETERDVLDLLAQFAGDKAIATIETVGVMPAQGIVSAFTFGRNVGGLHMALAAARIPYNQVVPRKWQAAMQCLSGGDKNITKRRAQQLFPHEKVTHAIADALLIAEYCRRIQRGIIGGVAHGKEEGAGAQQISEAGRIGPGKILGIDIGKGKDRTVLIDPRQFIAGGRRAGKADAQGRTAVAGAPRARAGARRAAR